MKKILLLTDFSSGYSRNLLRGIVRYAKEHEPWVFFRMPQYYRELYGDDGVVKWAKKWKADAIIAQLENINLNKLNKLKVPIIIQNYKVRASKICNITGDYIKTGVMAADFFLKRGYSNFAFYGFNDMIWSRERADGFKRRVEEAGYRVFVLNIENRRNEDWSFDVAAVSHWLLSLPKPVALFACDDYFASQITEICKIFNMIVPDEISVLGVDNDDLICNISDPPLSSIVLDVEKGGYQAASVLHQLMNREIAHACDIVIPPLNIEIRKSTDKYAVNDKFVMLVIDYIKKKYAQPICITDVMRLVPLSRRMIEKRFKKEMGVSIYQFILNYKIEQFSQSIISTDRPMVELAMDCGFEDYKNISRMFQKYKGTTPLQYRKMHQLIETNQQKDVF